MKIRAIRRNCTFCRSLFSLLFHDMICVTVYVFRAAMNKIALKKVCSISKNLLTKASVCSIITYVAGITQLVEYLTRNEEVEGSSPFSSSQKSAAMDYTTENCLLHIRREVRVITDFPASIRFDYPLTDTQRIVCLSEDNLRTEDYLLSITRLFYPTKRFSDNQPTQCSDLWVLHKECLPTFNV